MRIPLACLFLIAVWMPASAQTAPIEIESATARPTYGQTRVGAAYLRLKNNQDQDDRLTGAEAPIAQRIELHTTETKSDIMRMRRIDDIPVPAHGTAEMKPGAAHLMLFTLRQPLTEGMHVPMILHFEHAGAVAANFVVQ